MPPPTPTDSELLAEWAAIASRVVEREIRPHAIRGVREVPSIEVALPWLPGSLHQSAILLLEAAGWTVLRKNFVPFKSHEVVPSRHLEGVQSYIIMKLSPAAHRQFMPTTCE